jgi:hypothetical protein
MNLSIETEDDMHYLLHSVLLKRYSTMIDGDPTPPINVIEKAVDLHALRVIGSSGYQVRLGTPYPCTLAIPSCSNITRALVYLRVYLLRRTWVY